MPSPETKWWEVTISGENIEERSYLLFEAGIQGLEITSAQSAKGYLQSTPIQLDQFRSQITSFQFKIEKIVEVAAENWTQRCEELWEPLSIGALKIVPVANSDQMIGQSDPAANTIRIIPGMGFGTGHHDSTNMAIQLLQNSTLAASGISSILDLGTGSGILAIACAKLFTTSLTSPIKAVDIDPDALANAIENTSMNGPHLPIEFQQGVLSEISGTFNLIVANIYAEVLCDLHTLFKEKLSSCGFLLLSGIMKELTPSIDKTFSESEWGIVGKESTSRWHARLLKKR